MATSRFPSRSCSGPRELTSHKEKAPHSEGPFLCTTRPRYNEVSLGAARGRLHEGRENFSGPTRLRGSHDGHKQPRFHARLHSSGANSGSVPK